MTSSGSSSGRSCRFSASRRGDVLIFEVRLGEGEEPLSMKGDFVNGDFVGVAEAEFARDRGGVV